MEKVQEAKCQAVLDNAVCQKPAGHSGKHQDQGNRWTDAGAARVKKELEQMK
jgi:hypothetical protein